jgi:trans-AT polyketide synthase/acyltransferase/oxidoreductase domain-containing protein
METAELFLEMDIPCIEASAFLQVTPALVYLRLRSLSRNGDGAVVSRQKILAKVSRPEVARGFLAPAPAEMAAALVRDGKLTQAQADMGAAFPMCDDLCVEADSGGHTDRGVALVLLPVFLRMRDQAEREYGYAEPVHVGLGGGIGTPEAIAAAFMLGAEFVLTGSVNICTVEAGTSDLVKDMLQTINVQDTDYAPAGDMFEMGVKVQVMKRGLLFPARANRLFHLYNHYESWNEIPETQRAQVETQIFRKPFAEVWAETERHHREKGQIETLERAARSEKHKMALAFKWYFGLSTRAAFTGDAKFRADLQIHAGPALGAFNQWVKGTPWESWRERHVDRIAEKLMGEAALLFQSRARRFAEGTAYAVQLQGSR